jgi:uncharacterized protein
MIEISIIALFTFLGVVAQTIVGFGVAALLIPILFLVFDPPTAITIILCVANILCILVLWNERQDLKLDWVVVMRLWTASLPGILLGAYILTHLEKRLLLITIGLLIITTTMIQEYIFPKPVKPLGVSKGITISGFMAGLLTSAATTAPAPLVLWMRQHTATPDQIRHNLAAIFLLMNIASIPVIYWFRNSSLQPKGLLIVIVMIPVIIAGYALGRYAGKRINIRHYRKLVFVAVIFSGIVCLALGIQA